MRQLPCEKWKQSHVVREERLTCTKDATARRLIHIQHGLLHNGEELIAFSGSENAIALSTVERRYSIVHGYHPSFTYSLISDRASTFGRTKATFVEYNYKPHDIQGDLSFTYQHNVINKRNVLWLSRVKCQLPDRRRFCTICGNICHGFGFTFSLYKYIHSNPPISV